MAFLRRLGWYLAGLSLGMVFLVFFLKQKSGDNGIDFCYFPNCRVLKDMRSKPLAFDAQLPITYRDTLLIQSFLTDGTVDFGKSNPQSKPCKTYYITHAIAGKTWVLQALNCQDTVTLRTLTPADY